VPLAAIAVLVLNDHVLKAAYPGFVTGKLSDVAGLAFFPLLLVAAYELVTKRPASAEALVTAVVTTALVFSLVQIWPLATDAYRWGLGAIQWPVRAAAAGTAEVPIVPVQVMPDPTDLITVPAVLIALATGWRRATADERPAPPASCTSSS
jgi:hypothetical protein